MTETKQLDGQPRLIDFEKWKLHVLAMLASHGDSRLTYHSAEHTNDVLLQCERIAHAEGITDEEQLLPLKIAALYHDTGFLITYQGHEEKSCETFIEQFKNEGFSQQTMELICSLIMVTKIPQIPKTHLEEIICDADLDYLGRDDFESISNELRKEFLAYGFVQNDEEWNEVQINFFENHRYFTKTALNTRAQRKEQHLHDLKLQAGVLTINK